MSDPRPCVIFDLDDTLYDCTGQVKNKLIWKAARDLCSEVPGDVSSVYQEMIRVRRLKPLEDCFHNYLLSRFGNEDNVFLNRLKSICKHAYSNVDSVLIGSGSGSGSDVVVGEAERIALFEGARSMLEEMKKQGWRMFILTKGDRRVQNLKLDLLGIRDFFEGIYICSGSDGDKKLDVMKMMISVREMSVDRLVIVGDRPDSELSVGLRLGARYVIQYIHGVYRDLEVKDGSGDGRRIDFKVVNMNGLRSLLMEKLYGSLVRRWKVVCIGGGTGQPLLLSGLMKEGFRRRMDCLLDLVSVVAMTDSGRSSGKLRKLLGCPPPGDCRNCLASLAGYGNQQEELLRLFQHRFGDGCGELSGHSLGNLMLAGLWQMNGCSFGGAVDSMSLILGVPSNVKVLPVCGESVDLCAQLENGLARGEVEVRRIGKSAINRVWVEYSDRQRIKDSGSGNVPVVGGEVVSEIESADVVILGPGSFWTSVMCNFGYEGMIQALAKCQGKVIWVANLTTQPGQTDGMDFMDHYRKMVGVLGKKVLDGVVINTRRPPEEVISRYQKDGVYYLGHSSFIDGGFPVEVISGDIVEGFISEGGEGVSSDRNLWQKQDSIRHDSSKLSQVIFDWILRKPE